MVAAAHSYANGGREKSVTRLVFSGYSATISTFLKKTKLWRDSMPIEMLKILSLKKRIVCCLDNN